MKENDQDQRLDLSTYNWPEVTQLDIAFPTFGAPKELVEEAEKRDLKKGRAKFNELFYQGGSLNFQPDVKGTWKEKAILFARAMMGSFKPKHEHKEVVCAMIFEETLIL